MARPGAGTRVYQIPSRRTLTVAQWPLQNQAREMFSTIIAMPWPPPMQAVASP
jgi:hypothetical protein